jgi:S1-C subfamily serine protease
MSQWWVRIRGRVLGPMSDREVRNGLKAGEFQDYHECSSDGVNWLAVAEVPEFAPPDRPRRMAAPVGRRDAADADDGPRRRRYEDDYAPRPRANRTYLVLLAALGGVVVVGVAITAVLLLVKGAKDAVAHAGVVERMSDLPVSEQTKLRTETVGLVVTGEHVRFTDGGWIEQPMSGGSGFVVSPSGKVLTNKHVVAPHLKWKEAKERTELEKKFGFTVTPKLWMFFGKEGRYECEVVYVSENYDLAVLDPHKPAGPFLALCDTPDADIPHLKGLTAVGFPGNDRSARKWLEGGGRPNTSRAPSIQHAFDDADFKASVDTGDVRKTPSALRVEGDPIAFYLQHSASTAHGNSGGPLLASDGTVVGINTIIRPVKVTDTEGNTVTISQGGQNYALTLRQMKAEITRHVPDAVWRKHPE